MAGKAAVMSGFLGGVIASILLPFWMLAVGALFMAWLARKEAP